MKRPSDECLKEVGAVFLKYGFKEIATSLLKYGADEEHEAELIIVGDIDSGVINTQESAWGVQNALEQYGIRRERFPEGLQGFLMPHSPGPYSGDRRS